MKKIILLTLLSIFSIASTSQACSVTVGYELPMKNKIITTIANKYNVDMVNSKITLSDYYHQSFWTFNDSGFDCHDTDVFNMTITMIYSEPWSPDIECETKVEVQQTAGPQTKGGPYIIERNITEIYNSCKE